jgi:deoxyribodipyrimidine photo-lyase
VPVRGAALGSFRSAPRDGIRSAAELGLQSADKPLRQRGGRKAAVALLSSFFTERSLTYRKGMSSPLTAHAVCSRLSPHLAYGTLSMREVVHATWRRRDALLAEPPSFERTQLLHALKSFESRLHWHCHFMQKLESEPEIEWRNLHHAANGLRPDPRSEPGLLAQHVAWANGSTGVPMVDACMRMLNATGWVNFRMRAMLVAFSSYHLWHHWAAAAEHLAREFLDYEPGIHYPQIQMQSGTTGINLPRIYNPIKQARDQDPDGTFVRQWCPELARLPTEHVFEPWLAPASVQQEAGCLIERHYPAPIIDLKASAAHARTQIWALRGEPEAKREAKAIFQKHGSRNPNREGLRKGKTQMKMKTREAESPQQVLF